MAHLTYARFMADAGSHHQDRRLMHDTTTASVHHSEQRIPPKHIKSSSTHANEGHGDEHSATDEAANEDDDEEEEEDSSTAQDDENADEDEDPDVPAPSYGPGKGGKGKGKRPVIRVEPVDANESQDEDDEIADQGTGLKTNKHPVNQLLMSNKKRSFSNLSSTSVLFGDDSTDQETFPRRKMARKLSNMATKPLLTYKEGEDETNVKSYENAIESDDDDEDYSGVNLVPEEDDIELEEQEESYILQEEQQATTLLNQFRDARRLSLDSTASDDMFTISGPLDETFMSNLPDFGFAQFFEPEALPESPVPIAKRKFSDSSAKRVRFEDEVKVSDSSDSESSELDSSVFPDLFLEQDKLPPILHQLMDIDPDDDDDDMASPMSDGSFWDFGQEEPRIAQVHETDEESSGESSGYESDMGDTTDEEDYATDNRPVTPVQKQSVLRQPASAPGSRAATPKPFERSSRPVGHHVPPMRGIFKHTDSNAAIAITNKTTRTVTFYRPRTQVIPWIPLNGYHSSTESTANNSPRTSIALPNPTGSDSEVSNEVFNNNNMSTDIMFSGIFGSAPGNDHFFGTESIGPPEAFYPFATMGMNGGMFENMDEYGDDDSDDYEDELNITDFMDFGSDGDDTDYEQEDEAEDTDRPVTPATSTNGHFGSTPAHPQSGTPVNRKRTTSDVMLEHFDRGVVTAFRNNQNRYRDVASLPSDPAARASVSRPVRSGRTADSLITPLRKRSRSNRVAKSPLKSVSNTNLSSPLTGVSKATTRLQNSMMSPPQRRPPPRMGTFS